MLFALGAAQASGQEAPTITLESLDGSVVLTGAFQGFEAGYYQIIVVGIGLVSIAEDLVICRSGSLDCAALTSTS